MHFYIDKTIFKMIFQVNGETHINWNDSYIFQYSSLYVYFINLHFYVNPKMKNKGGAESNTLNYK